MQSAQALLKTPNLPAAELTPLAELRPQLVLAFGDADRFATPGLGASLTRAFPGAIVMGCSTAGEISREGVFDKSLVVTAMRFGKAELRAARAPLGSMEGSRDAGRALGRELAGAASGLRAIFVLGQGVNVNGSELIRGLREEAGAAVVITGGLAGDGGKFERTYTLLNGEITSDHVVAFGTYGPGISVGYGSMGGWEPFGPVRRVTRSDRNVLYELDGKPALEVYKTYLGDQARNLPASGLLFPFAILKENQDQSGLIRTILAVDAEKGSLTFAGDIPQNGLVRLMHTDNRGLVSGAENAARAAFARMKPRPGGVAVLVSCVGRKLVLGGDVDEEIEAVQEVFEANGEAGGLVTGFYSYGEICPLFEDTDCRLHNQTMTVTYLAEDAGA